MTGLLVLALGIGGGAAAWYFSGQQESAASAGTSADTADAADDATADPTGPATPTATDTAQPEGSSSTEAAAAPATGPGTYDPLGLGRPLEDQGCTGQWLVMLASATTPRTVRTTLAPVLSRLPESKYLVTDESCSSFVQEIDGRRIHAAYLGPFMTEDDACAARAEAGVAGSYVRLLDAARTARHVCSCRPDAIHPVLSKATDSDPAIDRRLIVSDVQVLLDRAGFNEVGAYEGSFGPLTQSWVRRLQRSADLPVTGVVDSFTWDALLESCD